MALIHRLGSHLIIRVGPHDLKSMAVTERIRDHDHRLIRLTGYHPVSQLYTKLISPRTPGPIRGLNPGLLCASWSKTPSTRVVTVRSLMRMQSSLEQARSSYCR